MVLMIVLAAFLIGLLCVFAYGLATYALPFMIGLTVAQLAYATGPVTSARGLSVLS